MTPKTVALRIADNGRLIGRWFLRPLDNDPVNRWALTIQHPDLPRGHVRGVAWEDGTQAWIDSAVEAANALHLTYQAAKQSRLCGFTHRPGFRPKNNLESRWHNVRSSFEATMERFYKAVLDGDWPKRPFPVWPWQLSQGEAV